MCTRDKEQSIKCLIFFFLLPKYNNFRTQFFASYHQLRNKGKRILYRILNHQRIMFRDEEFFPIGW